MDKKQMVLDIFKNHQVSVSPKRMDLLDRFLQDEQNQSIIDLIIQSQEQLMGKWKREEQIAQIIQQPVRILNATVGKSYETKFDFGVFGWKDISDYSFEGLEQVGLQFDAQTQQITGVPTQSGDIKFFFRFKLNGQAEEAPYNEKVIPLIINPDPKSLWKNLESDQADPFWKEDNVTQFAPLGDRHILVSSKRGRSHANVGSFREDDFAFAELEAGWSLVVVADGAGSAKLSRKGSALACQTVVDSFKEESAIQQLALFDDLLDQYQNDSGEETQKQLNRFVYNSLGKAAFQVHKQLERFAAEQSVTLKDLSSTLIFALFKRYERGYAILSFGVGDCPIGVLNKDVSEITMLNWLDVGEFGGGTRFITMPEIFKNEKFATRFGFKFIEDFSYLILMSDGIYDPKFAVEANLTDIKKWQEFLADLNGKNEDGVKVEFQADNEKITEQFSNWMDFWSPGNHDDRTLAIVF
jgi:serine/threonine protein phosphatase PrpC